MPNQEPQSSKVMPRTTNSIISLDIGAKRIGVAIASLEAKLPSPYTTLILDDQFYPNLKKIIAEEAVTSIVVGMPRNLDGQPTSQTYFVESFINEIKQHVDLPLFTQDEALTSRMAQEELEARGKDFKKADIDALAATYILQDYLNEYDQETA